MLELLQRTVLGEEPTLIIQSGNAGLQVLQVSLLDIPTWAHAVLAAVVVALSALTNRAVVTPTKSIAVLPPAAPSRAPTASS